MFQARGEALEGGRDGSGPGLPLDSQQEAPLEGHVGRQYSGKSWELARAASPPPPAPPRIVPVLCTAALGQLLTPQGGSNPSLHPTRLPPFPSPQGKHKGVRQPHLAVSLASIYPAVCVPADLPPCSVTAPLTQVHVLPPLSINNPRPGPPARATWPQLVLQLKDNAISQAPARAVHGAGTTIITPSKPSKDPARVSVSSLRLSEKVL